MGRFARKISHVRDIRRLGAALGNACAVIKDAYVYLKDMTALLWEDDNNGLDFTNIDSNAFQLNGVDNYIKTGIYIEKQTRIYYRQVGKSHLTSTSVLQELFYGGAYTTVLNGVQIYANAPNGLITVFIYGGGLSQNINTGLYLTNSLDYDYSIDWNGLIGGDVVFTLNGVTSTTAATIEMSNTAIRPIGLFAYRAATAPARFFKGSVYYAEMQINGIDYEIPFAVGESNKVWDVNTDNEFTILGTVDASSNILQDKYHNNVNNGFGLNGTAKMPASKLNIGFDTQGNALTNPSIPLGHNGSESGLLAPVDATLIAIDTEEILYTSGTPNRLAITDIPANGGDYLFMNVIEAGKNYQKLLVFPTPRTLEEKLLIDKCYIQDNTLPDGKSWVIDSNGLIQKDTNGVYQYS